MSRLLSDSSIKAICGLGDGVSFDDDVRPAFAAVGVKPVAACASVDSGPGHVSLYVPSTRDDIEQTLASLDLSDLEIVGRVLYATSRIARVFAAGRKGDQAALVRLANAVGDNAQSIESEARRVDEGTDGGAPYPVQVTHAGKGRTKVTMNRSAIARMMRDIQREFDKHSITVPVNADVRDVPATTNVYNGPVIHGSADGAQLAWNNQTVHQTRSNTEQIAPGFETLAQAVAKTLEGLAILGLPDDEKKDAEAAGHEILEEMTRAQPDKARIKRGLVALKGLLAPVAAGLSAGAGQGAQGWARTAIEQLGSSL